MTATDGRPARLTYRMREVAELTGAGLTTVKGWVATGALPSIRPSGPNGVVLIRPEDLDAFLAGHREGRDIRPIHSARSTRARRTA